MHPHREPRGFLLPPRVQVQSIPHLPRCSFSKKAQNHMQGCRDPAFAAPPTLPLLLFLLLRLFPPIVKFNQITSLSPLRKTGIRKKKNPSHPSESPSPFPHVVEKIPSPAFPLSLFLILLLHLQRHPIPLPRRFRLPLPHPPPRSQAHPPPQEIALHLPPRPHRRLHSSNLEFHPPPSPLRRRRRRQRQRRPPRLHPHRRLLHQPPRRPLTFEECKTVRSILRGFRVSIDERDLAMDVRFLHELKAILGKNSLPLPRVFIGGKYIGGADEIRMLHEAGELKKIVDGFPKIALCVCGMCGGSRFLLCTSCSGSHKCYSDKGGFRSCSLCNENGLIRCPECC